MKCPHCLVEIHPAFGMSWIDRGAVVGSVNDVPSQFQVHHMACPSCTWPILRLQRLVNSDPQEQTMVFPPAMLRPKAPVEVPPDLASDFNEACAVLVASPKASAALSRRCLQSLLRSNGYTQHDLAKAIDAVLASKSLPSALASNLDAIRNIGNFAAHPIKDTNSGAIVEVEPVEAEWNLDVLDGLFDYYFVQPARDKARSDALNAKLAAAGKPAMKQ